MAAQASEQFVASIVEELLWRSTDCPIPWFADPSTAYRRTPD